MSKKFETWLDEFVENGADPQDVVNWGENAAGGGSGNILYPDNENFKLNITELAKYIKAAEDNEGENAGNYRFLYGFDGHGGSGVAPNYDTIDLNNGYYGYPDQFTITYSIAGQKEVLPFGNNATQSLSEALIANKDTLESIIIVGLPDIVVNVMAGYEDHLYEIDLDKILVFVEEPETPEVPQVSVL